MWGVLVALEEGGKECDRDRQCDRVRKGVWGVH